MNFRKNFYLTLGMNFFVSFRKNSVQEKEATNEWPTIWKRVSSTHITFELAATFER